MNLPKTNPSVGSSPVNQPSSKPTSAGLGSGQLSLAKEAFGAVLAEQQSLNLELTTGSNALFSDAGEAVLDLSDPAAQADDPYGDDPYDPSSTESDPYEQGAEASASADENEERRREDDDEHEESLKDPRNSGIQGLLSYLGSATGVTASGKAASGTPTNNGQYTQPDAAAGAKSDGAASQAQGQAARADESSAKQGDEADGEADEGEIDETLETATDDGDGGDIELNKAATKTPVASVSTPVAAASSTSTPATSPSANSATSVVPTPGTDRAVPSSRAAQLTAEMRHEMEQLIRSRRQQAAVKAVNHLTLQRGATSRVDVPTLGRITIDARSLRGEVDVGVQAREAGTVSVLQSVSGALEQELRNASINLNNLDIQEEDEDETEGRSDARPDSAEYDDEPSRPSRGRTGSAEPDDPAEQSISGSGSKRVRIVL